MSRNHFSFSRPDGSSLKSDMYRSQKPDASHKRFSPSVEKLPPKVDLRPFMTKVEDQQQTSSCVANATAGAYEYLVKKHENKDFDVSRLFIYWNGRAEEGATDDDGGMLICDAVKGLQECGCCGEVTWPFDADKVNEEPPQSAYEEARQFLVEDVQVVPLELDAWKSALAEGYPVIFGISLFKSFDKQKKPGLVPSPSKQEASRESHGGHAMLAVGYSDADKVFIVRNSWGTSWGDAGYCYIPYDYLMNDEYNDGDSWIIRQVEAVPEGDQGWADEDDGVLEDIEGEIANMSDDDYADLLDACGDVHLETRIAGLFITAAGADGTISEEEAAEIGNYMQVVLDTLGVDAEAADIIEEASKSLDEQVVTDSIAIFGERLSVEALGGMINQLQLICDADGTSDEEQAFVDSLVESWQVGEAEA